MRRKITLFWIWTICNHDYCRAQIGIYTFLASTVVVFLSLVGVLPLPVALNIILWGGLCNFAILWLCIESRRRHLKSISDPELKEIAYEAMLVLINKKKIKSKGKIIC
jgi:hypothetical protein